MNASPPLIPSTATFLSKLETMRRRVESRVSHRVPCHVRSVRAFGDSTDCAVGQTVNISTTGLAIQLGHPLDAGTTVEVRLPRQEGDPMMLKGRVAHSRRVMSGTYEIGIRIDEEPAEGRNQES